MKVLNCVDFALPARQYEVSYAVTLTERLPKVTEFCLRLIKVCERITPEDFARYFGFSSKELRIVLEDLTNQTLIEIQDGELCLTPYAHSKFSVSDDIPRFSAISNRNDKVKFDLHTFKPVSNDFPTAKKRNNNSFEIPISDEHLANSNKLAERAFQENFRVILNFLGVTKESIDIYKMGEIKTLNDFAVKIRSKYVLTENFDIERILEFSDESGDEFRNAIESLISESTTLSTESSDVLSKEFIERFDDRLLRQFLKNRRFDYQTYLTAVLSDKVKYGAGTEVLIGNLYAPGNRELVLKRLSEMYSVSQHQFGRSLPGPLIWLAPDSPLWGRSDVFSDFVEELLTLGPTERDTNNHISYIDKISVLYPSSKKMMASHGRQLVSSSLSKNSNFSISFFDNNKFPGALEVFLLPPYFACVLFHYRISENTSCPLPFGFITMNSVFVKEAQVAVYEAANDGSNYLGKKSKAGRDFDSVKSFQEDFSGLFNCPL